MERLEVNNDDIAAEAVRHTFHSFEQQCSASHPASPDADRDAPYRIIALILLLARNPLHGLPGPTIPFPLPRQSVGQVKPSDDDSGVDDDDEEWQAECSRSTSESDEEEDLDGGPSPVAPVPSASLQENSTAERWATSLETEKAQTEPSSSQSDFLRALDVVWWKVEDRDAGEALRHGFAGGIARHDDGNSVTSSPLTLQRQLRADAEKLNRTTYTAPVPVVSEAFVVFHLLLLCQHLPSTSRHIACLLRCSGTMGDDAHMAV